MSGEDLWSEEEDEDDDYVRSVLTSSLSLILLFSSFYVHRFCFLVRLSSKRITTKLAYANK